MSKRSLIIIVFLCIISCWKFTPEVRGVPTEPSCTNCPCSCPCGEWHTCNGYDCGDVCGTHHDCSHCGMIECTCISQQCSCAPCPPTQGPTWPPEPTEPPYVWPTERPPTEPPGPTTPPHPTRTPTPILPPTATPIPPPTSTPAPPTITPIPPTSTPIPPTSTPVPTATPTLPPSCDCDEITYDKTPAKGVTVIFKTYAKVVNPDTNNAKVLNMVYHVEANGSQIAQSEERTATFEGKTTDPKTGKLIERYSTTWSYTIPSQGSGEVAYRVWVKINCAYKTAQVSNKTVMVLAASTTGNQSFFDALLGFFSSLFGTTGITPTPTPTSIPTPSPTPRFAPPFVTEAVPTGRTLQLGTFFPTVRIEKDCREIKFWIVY